MQKVIILLKILIVNLLLFACVLQAIPQLRLERVFVAQITLGKNVGELPIIKIEAGLNLVSNLSQKFVLIPSDTIDSLLNIIKSQGIKPTTFEIGKRLNSDKALFINIDRFVNILRVDVSVYDFRDSSTKNAIGYGSIRYYRQDKNEPILDPAILQAFQRAFAIIYNDSLMFFNLEGSLKIKPAPTLVIGSINYIEDDTLRTWDIFRKKQVTSFFAIETIYEVARTSPDFVVYDIESRDSAYALLNLYEPENYSPVSPIEVRALQMLEVEYFLAGEFFRQGDSSKIRLALTKVEKEGLVIIREEEATIEKDSLEEYQKVLQDLTRKILKIGG